MSVMSEPDEEPAPSDSQVTLGDVTFDPVATQDFRLSVEGTSGTGKSNTLSVILEDLAGVAVPTLIVERLGALSPVRLEDDRMVVVGAREEEGIDLAVALEDLDKLGSWILDRGMKILLDVSTYADYEQEGSRVHEAAARAVQSLNDRAHEKYRAGDRTKSLLFVDEAHYLAPKDSAPEPELDEHVKRARGQIIKVATEGGNKGISVVVGYQRRAFLHNGVIQLAQDFIAHRPGDEDIGRTADALRCSEEELAALGTGEILARGPAITDGELVGPTTVRKRTSPDPREESFDLPDTSDELADVLEEMQEEVEAEREQREQRQDELERLREQNERLQERVDELEQELADTDRLADALSNLSGGGGAAADVGEGVADLQERVAELKAQRDNLADDLEDVEGERDAVREERDQLQEQVADLEAEVQELRSAFDAAAEDVASLAERFDVAADVDADAGGGETELRGRLQDAHERIDDLEAENRRLREASGAEVAAPDEYDEFVEDEYVRQAIEEAKDEASVARHVKGVVAGILRRGGAVTQREALDDLDLTDNSASHIGRAMKALENAGVVSLTGSGMDRVADFDFENVQQIHEQQARKKRTEKKMEEL